MVAFLKLTLSFGAFHNLVVRFLCSLFNRTAILNLCTLNCIDSSDYQIDKIDQFLVLFFCLIKLIINANKTEPQSTLQTA